MSDSEKAKGIRKTSSLTTAHNEKAVPNKNMAQDSLTTVPYSKALAAIKIEGTKTTVNPTPVTPTATPKSNKQ